MLKRSKGFAFADAVMGLVMAAVLISVAVALCRDLVSKDRPGGTPPASSASEAPKRPAAF